MNKKILSFLGSIAGLGLFIAAVTVLHRELKEYHYLEIMHALKILPLSSLGWAGGFTALNYGVLSIYELLGFRYVGSRLSRLRIVFTSFISYAFSNNVGFYAVSGSAVRFRLYSQFGLSAIDITKLIVFVNGAAFWLGLCAVCSLVFIAVPFTEQPPQWLPAGSTAVIGLIFLTVLCAALVFAAFRKKPVRFRQWEFDVPRFPLLVALIFTACLDWVLCAASLYALLPSGEIPFASFLGIFLLAMLTGLISHVPGGLGVFESTMLLMLPHGNTAALFGALLSFRAIYYLIPLGAASALLGGFELLHRKREVADALQTFGRWGSDAVPYLFALLTFIGGMVLLFSGATPSQHHRLRMLMHFVPLLMLEVSHFMGSLFGIALIMLAWGLYRRLDAAYHFTLYLFCGGALFSLLKGLDYEETIILMSMALILLPGKKHFYRKTSLIGDRFSPGWLFMIGVALVSTFWLGMFSYKHVQYANELWWKFGLHDNAPRFMRAMVGSMVAAFTFSVLQFWAPVRRTRHILQATDDDAGVKEIVGRSPSTNAWLALLGDKRFLFDDGRRAFIMYGIEGRSWIAMGDPVGDTAAFPALIWRFREECDRHNGRPVFYEVSHLYLPLYLDLGLTLLKMGEEGRVPLEGFTLEGGARKSLRHTLHRLEQEECTFEVMAPENVEAVIPALKEISDRWLANKKVREKHFSLGYFHDTYLKQTPVAVVRLRGDIVAFANLWISGTKSEVSVDLMRYSDRAPKNVIDFLFGNIMRWGAHRGFGWFNLGMAPFSGLDDRALAPWWSRLGALLYRHGDNFYNFKGLRQYKEKFDPVWEPRYLATLPGLGLPLIFKDLSSIISGGLKGAFTR
jgi:phosphatidylglycerol lysyltransferase